MIFGYTDEQLQQLGATFTAKEIHHQPRLWAETLGMIVEQRKEIEVFLDQALKSNTRIVLTGAGTSDYVGTTIARHLGKILGVRVEAIATTDIVSNPAETIIPDLPTILVSFARSGNSPESVGAFQLFQQNAQQVQQVVITCNPDGELAKLAQADAGNRVLIMPEGSNDKSFAMTSSFTCMMLAALLFFDIKNLSVNREYVNQLVRQGEAILENEWSTVQEVCQFNPERIVYLGSGYLVGLCHEMMLKNMELTNGQIVAMYESILGFRHGPKTVINDKTLIVVVTSSDAYTHLYDIDLIKELDRDAGGHQVVVLSYQENASLKPICDKLICIGGASVPPVYESFNYILYGQMIGLCNSIKLGFTPDNPVPSGAVNRVVQGVTIHPYK